MRCYVCPPRARRLFTALPPTVCLLFTSNQRPAGLFQQGRRRKDLQPFVDMVMRWGGQRMCVYMCVRACVFEEGALV